MKINRHWYLVHFKTVKEPIRSKICVAWLTMVKEDGVYKIWKEKILEVDNPGMDWFYE